MKNSRHILNIVFSVMVLFTSVTLGFAQELDDNENWIGNIEGGNPPFLMHRYETYSKLDVLNAKRIVEAFEANPEVNNEWHGKYMRFGMLSEAGLILDKQNGFVTYSIYTCSIELRRLDYGKVIETDEYLEIVSERSSLKVEKGKRKPTRYIKTIWGDRPYLIVESELLNFAEVAAGYYGSDIFDVPASESFWSKREDNLSKKIFGAPKFPGKYRRFERAPIESEIVSISEKAIKRGFPEYLDLKDFQSVTINVGSQHGVKPGMQFFVPDLNDRVSIQIVTRSSAIGYISKYSAEELKTEECYFQGKTFLCANPKIGMKVMTVPDELVDN